MKSLSLEGGFPYSWHRGYEFSSQWLVPFQNQAFSSSANTSLLVHNIGCMLSVYLLLSLASSFLWTGEDNDSLTQGHIFKT